MPIAIRHIQTMAEMWFRKDEPATADLRRALHIARVLEETTSSPIHLRAIAWHLVVDTHNAVEWKLPADHGLPSCRAAAASTSHSASLLTDQISEHVRDVESPVLVLGVFPASRSLFGRWDLVPANGALLVSLDLEDDARSDGTDLPEIHGIRWAAPGNFRKTYEEHASPASVDGARVLVPNPELIAARSKFRLLRPEEPETLLFCGAALAATSNGRWHDVNRLAKVFGHASAPTEFAVSLQLDYRLGLDISRRRRVSLALRRLLRR